MYSFCMSNKKTTNESLTHLGSGKTEYPTDYAPQLLECFSNKSPALDYMVKLDAPEFTSLCPITSQPDFARILINYIPDKKLVESKSLKLYLFSFRNHGEFHENCVNTILNDLINLLSPKYIEVLGLFTPRGGIAIHPFANFAKEDAGYNEFKKQRMFDILNNKQ